MAGTKAYPTLDFNMVASTFKAKMEAKGLGSKAAGQTKDTSLAVFAELTDGTAYSYSAGAAAAVPSLSWILELPHEAIKSVNISTPAVTWTGVTDLSIAHDAASPTTSGIAVRDLFEQVIAAGRLASNGLATEFVAGDKIEIVVSFALSNTRTYNLDADYLSTGSTQFALFKNGGSTYTLVNGTTLTSSSVTKTVKYIFTAGSA
jgi:hypothetical protein